MDEADQDPLEKRNPFIAIKPRLGTSWKTHATMPLKLLVSFSVDGFVVAEVVIDEKTPMREIEQVAIEVMESWKIT